jgi:hypothetical protein
MIEVAAITRESAVIRNRGRVVCEGGKTWPGGSVALVVLRWR